MREYTRELQDIKARVRERPYLFEQLKQVSDIVKLRRLHHIVHGIQHNFEFLLAEKCKSSCRADIQEHADESRLEGAIC